MTAQKYLLDPGAPVQALANEAFEFRFGMYDDQPVYRGPIGFTKHFLDRVPAFDGLADGEEARCAQALDSLKQVKHWVRNVAKHPASFWLQTSTQRTYPDFVAELADGRFFVVEYKGANQWADAAEDRAIGEVWARATGNIYLMARAKDDHGRTTLDQLLAVIF
jgi:type III restriction enzyme